ncbi:MAG TPA: tetratricopeptide repeat protein [Gemmatimonadaceae bacterium]
MTDLAEVRQHLEGVKSCAPADVAAHFAPALRAARFLPVADRHAVADEFVAWARDHTWSAPVKFGYAVVLQAMDRFMAEDNEAALPLLTLARTVFSEHRDTDGVALSAMFTGAIYRTFGNYDLALTVLWEAHELLSASGKYPSFLAANANSMANIDLDLGHLDDARQMFELTFRESERADDFYFMVYALHGLGRVFMRQEKSNDARAMFQRALELAEKHQHPLQISNSLTELANLAFVSRDMTEAESLTVRALAIREQHHLQAGAVTNCLRLGEIYGKRSQWMDALAVLTRGLAIAEDTKIKPKIAQAHQMLSDAYERLGDPAKSLVHYKRFHELREQVEREDSARKVADAKLVFEAERTRQENAVIKSQKAEIERKNIELQDKIDELTRAKISRRARALTFALVLVLFVFQDAILGTALRLLASNNYFVLLAVKMAIIFSLSPINRAIEGYLLRRVIKADKTRQQATISATATS